MRPKGQIFDLKAFRAKYNLTQKEIAEAVNRPQSFLSAIEHERRSAPPGFLDDLARIYNVDNISDYIRDRDMSTCWNVKNVSEAIVNAPGGTILMNDFVSTLPQNEILRFLAIGKIVQGYQKQSETQETQEPQVTQEQAESQKEQKPTTESTISNLVKLLYDSQERYSRAEDRIKELEAKILDLESHLPKRKMKRVQ